MKTGTSTQTTVVLGTLITMAILIVGVNCVVWNAEAADDGLKPDVSLSGFMRKKLEASSQILEGLTTEDSELIERGAKTLGQLSRAEKWQILSDPEYREYSADFRNTVRKLAEAAEKKNFDNAAIQWIDTMKDCIECHQHVRRERTNKR